MFKNKFLLIDGERYRLFSHDGQVWRLLWGWQQNELNESGAHYLDYWCKKGVIVNEVEKEGQG